MTLTSPLIGLNIDSPIVAPHSPNFMPPSWPPPNDFPVVIDKDGNVVSRYGDSIWNLTPWSTRVYSINFGNGRRRKSDPGISTENSDLLRQIVFWWLYGPRAIRKTRTLIHRFEITRPLLIICSQHNIKASDLSRFPKIIEIIAKHIRPATATHALLLLHDIWDNRSEIGFFFLDAKGLSILATLIPDHQKSQTAYIPPRIWLYQLNRLRECIDDFNNNREQIVACYMFCLEAYSKNAGSLSKACSNKFNISEDGPFTLRWKTFKSERNGKKYYGVFTKTLQQFGLLNLIEKWISGIEIYGVTVFSTYFNLISLAGTAYLLNFSLMRIDEVRSLRSDCLLIERDEVSGEDIFMLQGVTTKTIEDGDARWITSPSAKVAIEAMTTVSRLRMICAEANPDVPATPEDIRNPLLVVRSYEPWCRQPGNLYLPLSVRLSETSYSLMYSRHPKLFDSNELIINEQDLQNARLITPSLNPSKYETGSQWPLAWHQLRRTGAVNMTASGVVSEPSVQYQLKHVTRAMARYYAQGFYHLSLQLNQESRAEYVRTMYEMIAREFSLLQSPRFISPHGESRKQQILSLISGKDHKALKAAAKSGKISYRGTLFGGCTYNAPCPHGGYDDVARCGGGDGSPPCADGLIDQNKSEIIRQYGEVINDRLKKATEDSPLHASLQAQQRSIENTIHVIKLHNIDDGAC